MGLPRGGAEEIQDRRTGLPGSLPASSLRPCASAGESLVRRTGFLRIVARNVHRSPWPLPESLRRPEGPWERSPGQSEAPPRVAPPPMSRLKASGYRGWLRCNRASPPQAFSLQTGEGRFPGALPQALFLCPCGAKTGPPAMWMQASWFGVRNVVVSKML